MVDKVNIVPASHQHAGSVVSVLTCMTLHDTDAETASQSQLAGLWTQPESGLVTPLIRMKPLT